MKKYLIFVIPVILVLPLLYFTHMANGAVPNNIVRIHYHRFQGDYEGWGLHLWGDQLNLHTRVSWFSPWQPAGRDDFGIYFDVPIKPGAPDVGFILHKRDVKNVNKDMQLLIRRHGYEIWQIQNDSKIYTKRPIVPGQSSSSSTNNATQPANAEKARKEARIKAEAEKAARRAARLEMEKAIKASQKESKKLLELMQKKEQQQQAKKQEEITLKKLKLELTSALQNEGLAREQLSINRDLVQSLSNNLTKVQAALDKINIENDLLKEKYADTQAQLSRTMEQRNNLITEIENQPISIWFWVALIGFGGFIVSFYPLLKSRKLTVENTALTTQATNLLQQLSDERQKHRDTENKITEIANNDELTGLLNRTIFQQNAQQAVAQAKRYGRKLALLFIDLDRFKFINDTLGHDAGDHVLKTIAERFKQCTRESDTLARLGGDEFVLLIQDLTDTTFVSAVAQKLLGAADMPFLLAGQEYQVTASVGISTYPADGKNASVLLKNADIAMYRAKEQGKNNFQFYSEQMNMHSLQRIALESSLRQALQRQEILVHFQPIIDTRIDEMCAVEALVRWQHPDMGLVSPLQFIPIAEETGLIIPIGNWLIEQVCTHARKWHDKGKKIRVSINLSARQLDDPNLLPTIQHILAKTGFPPHFITLELTESMMMSDPEEKVLLFQKIKDLDIKIAIDDFGTGYSSLSYLKRFPIDILKIDRSFLQDIPNDTDDVAITQTIIAIGEKMGLELIAEGVEETAQLEFLQEHGCHVIQGYLFSKPLAAEELAPFFDKVSNNRV